MPEFLKFEDTEMSEDMSQDLSEAKVNMKRYATRQVEKLFRIEYLCTSIRELASYSLTSKQSNCLYFPIHAIIPLIEERFDKDDQNIEFFEGLLAKFMSIDLKNEPKLTVKYFSNILDHKRCISKSVKEIMLLRDPPKYLTFCFEYKQYFDNFTCYDENSDDLKFYR